MDPRLATREQIAALGALGFNRLSAGVQDFNEETQTSIHRVQSEAQTVATIQWARESAIGGINVDLIYGLPHQTRATFAQTVRRVQTLAPDTVAMYAYAHVPWINHAQRVYEAALPPQFEKFGMLIDATRAFAQAGYRALGIDHFAAPGSELAAAAQAGRLQRTFMGYTPVRSDTLIGVGASAISSSPEAFSQNRSDVAEYIAAARDADLPQRGCVLSQDDRARQRAIADIMTKGSTESQELVGSTARAALEPLAAEGLAVLERGRRRSRRSGGSSRATWRSASTPTPAARANTRPPYKPQKPSGTGNMAFVARTTLAHFLQR